MFGSLQNIIERAVIVSPGKILRVQLAELEDTSEFGETLVPSPSPKVIALKDAERKHLPSLCAIYSFRLTVQRVTGANTSLTVELVSDFLEKPRARESPVIINGRQRNPKNL